jgi:chemotaxis protein histidine kinase CheA
MSFSQQEIEEFKVEALELLDLAEKSVLALDAGAEFRASFDTIFRGFHNLKGGAGMMELLKLQAHTHELENILMGFKNESSIPKEYLSLFLRGIDAARTLLDGKEVSFSFAVNTSAETPPVAAAPQTAETHTDELASLVPQNVEPLEEEKTEVAAVEEALPQTEQALPQATLEVPDSAVEEFVVEGEEIVERISSSLQGIEKNDYNKDSIDALYRDAHSLKGTAYLFSYADLGDLAHAMESSLEQVRAGTHSPSSELLDALFKSLKVVESLLGNIRKKKN